MKTFRNSLLVIGFLNFSLIGNVYAGIVHNLARERAWPAVFRVLDEAKKNLKKEAFIEFFEDRDESGEDLFDIADAQGNRYAYGILASYEQEISYDRVQAEVNASVINNSGETHTFRPITSPMGEGSMADTEAGDLGEGGGEGSSVGDGQLLVSSGRVNPVNLPAGDDVVAMEADYALEREAPPRAESTNVSESESEDLPRFNRPEPKIVPAGTGVGPRK